MGKTYSDIHSEAVINGQRRLQRGCRYGWNKSETYHYRTDLFRMKQKNLNTGTVRTIRRLATIVTQPPFTTDVEDAEEGSSDMDQDEGDAFSPIADAGVAGGLGAPAQHGLAETRPSPRPERRHHAARRGTPAQQGLAETRLGLL